MDFSLRDYANNYESPRLKAEEIRDNRLVAVYDNGLVQYLDYEGKLSENELTKIIENYSVYKAAGDSAGVPWQMVAAVHYRENSLGIESERYGGPFQFDSEHFEGEDDFVIGAHHAARFLQEKSGYRLDTNTEDPHIIKDAFFRYNGTGYGSYDKSPYVMNRFDSDHEDMVIKGTLARKNEDGSVTRIPVETVDKRLGAHVFFLELKSAFQ